jgi:hypothetical protein
MQPSAAQQRIAAQLAASRALLASAPAPVPHKQQGRLILVALLPLAILAALWFGAVAPALEQLNHAVAQAHAGRR